ncbi:hypothetical protein VM1G_05984 [Cytospora mali]|uniref:DUF7924 domain-containing protein n=1 Tax=Cytospora mali TaxID=578113 RepID=A0A194W479_CYTMA|nr:hypothetical protein VM1G_05984 [Valsa mali]
MVRTNVHSCRSTSLTGGERRQGIRKEARPLRRSARLHRTSLYVEKSPSSQHSNGLNVQVSPEGSHTETASDDADSKNPIDYWRKYQHWPRTYFDPEGNISHLLARKKSTSTLRRKSSASAITSSNTTTPTQSDQKPRKAKCAPYRDPRYKTLLAARGSFMHEDDAGISQEGKRKCMALLSGEQAPPAQSLFSDDLFQSTCRKIQDKNETRVLRDISLLLVPSAETLETYGAKNLKCLTESTNEGWNNSIPITSTRPQPDYSVGFRSEAFTAEQLKLLGPFVGTPWDKSYFAATWYMYFPFLTCEVNCGALDIADRQNAHSATLAVRAVVELFRLVKREKEIDREILAFSVSHDCNNIRIYGHYPVIDGKDTKYYRYRIRTFDFTELEGKEKWTAYRFTRNVYDNWMPDHFKRICSAIENLPAGINFDISQESELHFSSQTGLSQELDGQYLSQSEGSASVSSVANVDHPTPDTSMSQSFKKLRRR